MPSTRLRTPCVVAALALAIAVLASAAPAAAAATASTGAPTANDFAASTPEEPLADGALLARTRN
jgi:hypothetical protein